MLPSTMNHRPSTILPSITLLAVLMLASLAQAQTLTLDKCLDNLAERGSLGPVVSVMRAPVAGTADLSSLEGLAKTFGLKLFEQDGIHVLGPAECLHLYDLSPYYPKERPKQGVSPDDRFFYSLMPEQLRALGTRRGLGFFDLSEEQQSLVKAIFTGRITLSIPTDRKPADEDTPEIPQYWPIKPLPVPDSPDLPVPELSIGRGSTRETVLFPKDRYYRHVALDNLPIEQLTITGSLGYEMTSVGDGSEDYECTLCPLDFDGIGSAECGIDVEPDTVPPTPMPPRPFGPNVLKPSQLDYDGPELQKEVAFPVKTTLRDVIALAAKETGLPLFVGPGSEQVLLYVKAESQPIARMLKAISLATCGTWRQVGDTFIYSLDVTGLGSFISEGDHLDNLTWPSETHHEPPLDPARMHEVMFSLPPADGTAFSLTPQQINNLTSRLAQNPLEECSIPWSALTPEQQAAAYGTCDDLRTKQTDKLYLDPWVSADLVFHFPAVGNANVGYMPADYIYTHSMVPIIDPLISAEYLPQPWPAGSEIPLPSGIRGMICRVSKSDTPSRLVTSATAHGLNTLLVRVFSDGYTVFSSQQFPQLPGLKDDFLRNLIAVAHAKRIRVIGVIDALRWSDGDRKHWLYKTPELLDRDIAGRTNTEWMAQRVYFRKDDLSAERVRYGDSFDGDFVSPFQPSIRGKLSALISELASYDLDGLALDHTSIIYTDWSASSFDGEYDISPGQPGFNEMARSAFIRNLGVDPVDIASSGFAEDILPTPMVPMAIGAEKQMNAWKAFYRAACDALLDILVENCRTTSPGLPIWVIDAYRDSSMMTTLESHAWSEFEGRIDRVVGCDAAAEPEYAGSKIKTAQLVRVTDSQSLLYIGSSIALLQGMTFPGMLGEEDLDSPPDEPINDIILDFPCSEKRKTEFLKLLETARPAKTR